MEDIFVAIHVLFFYVLFFAAKPCSKNDTYKYSFEIRCENYENQESSVVKDVEFGKVFVAEQEEFDRVSERLYKLMFKRWNRKLEILEHNEHKWFSLRLKVYSN